MTFFLHVPELQAGIAAAQQALNVVDESDADNEKAKLVAMLDGMLSFAETNLEGMLNLMGFNNIDELNAALQNYKNLNFSVQQLFPAFSAPQMTEVLARAGIGVGNKSGTDAIDYGLILSALEDNVKNMFPQFMEEEFARGDIQNQIRENLSDPGRQDMLAAAIAAQLFGGLDLNATGVIDLSSGTVNFMSFVSKLGNLINKSARLQGSSGTSAGRTILPFYRDLLKPFIEKIIDSNMDMFINEHSYELLEKTLRETNPNFNPQILKERIRRGGITASAKSRVESSISDDTLSITTYLDALKVNVDPNIFNLDLRGKKSIENYVNDVCEANPAIREQIIENITNFYWKIITSYIPPQAELPITRDWFASLIREMAAEKSAGGNIGWFFSQGGTKALGAGMFGEVAGMIYMSVLCPKLKENARFSWAGGVTEGAKPPADIILGNALSQYGIQIKNYTSGSTLSHEYALKIKNIVDEAAENNNSNNKVDLMTLQATSELGITEAEIEAVQNVIVANTFNIPYRKVGDLFEAVGSIPAFSGARAELSAVYKQATRYMAVISVIMHRLQYAEEITRRVSATSTEKQLQNTLWLVNGNLFISSVQILNELKEYVMNSIDRFFSISTSVRISGDNLPEGIEEGNMTIVEYFNYSARGLGTTALSKVSARIGTNYKTSAFHR